MGFEMHLLGEGFHTLINGGLFSSPTNVGGHNPPPFGAQCSHWHSFLHQITVGPPLNPPPLLAHRLVSIPLRSYKWWFVLLPNQCRRSQSTPLWGPVFSLALFPSSNQCGTAPKSTSLTGTPPRVYPPSGNNEKASTSSRLWYHL